jgi:hypothetical protein
VKLCGSPVSDASSRFAGHCYSGWPCARKRLVAGGPSRPSRPAAARQLIRAHLSAADHQVRRRKLVLSAAECASQHSGQRRFVGEDQSSSETRRRAMPYGRPEFHCGAMSLAPHWQPRNTVLPPPPVDRWGIALRCGAVLIRRQAPAGKFRIVPSVISVSSGVIQRRNSEGADLGPRFGAEVRPPFERKDVAAWAKTQRLRIRLQLSCTAWMGIRVPSGSI